MEPFGPTPRRGFLARLVGGVAALTVGETSQASPAASQGPAASQDQWLSKLTGRHRCLFDFPLHGEGLPLIHMLNYITTYQSAYGEPPSAVNAVGTFYGPPGERASIPLAWNDAMWDKYKIGAVLKLNDPDPKAPTKRNMFYRPRAADPVLANGAFAAAGIENLQRMGATFLMCNNAFLMWIGFLSGSGTKANAAEIERDLRANLLPGVVTVPAMVIAIEKAQSKGIAYNRQ
jgi:intracellular sulfur oxidation DsrE/DsrF family protein